MQALLGTASCFCGIVVLKLPGDMYEYVSELEPGYGYLDDPALKRFFSSSLLLSSLE